MTNEVNCEVGTAGITFLEIDNDLVSEAKVVVREVIMAPPLLECSSVDVL